MADEYESIKDDGASTDKASEESIELDADELIEAYEEMVLEQKKFVVKNKELLDTIYRLEAQNDKLEDEIEVLKKDVAVKSTESDALRNENLRLKDENDRLRKGKEKLDDEIEIFKKDVHEKSTEAEIKG
ncbi:tropomyosin-1-like [Andrographis paniculata]|uniref:tropomyosin-1-like n=1 Tax=Andrographis paniculata TaxID=175694 RepID=UPI0021E83525|nr:tropomyosin-1-like [Andrographis paniculata]